MTDARQREDAYRVLFDAQFRPILGYSLRRTACAADAADVTAETLLIAGRRFDEIPPGAEARLWLYGARRVLANHARDDGASDGHAGVGELALAREEDKR